MVKDGETDSLQKLDDDTILNKVEKVEKSSILGIFLSYSIITSNLNLLSMDELTIARNFQFSFSWGLRPSYYLRADKQLPILVLDLSIIMG